MPRCCRLKQHEQLANRADKAELCQQDRAAAQALGHEHAQVLRRHIKERLKQDSGRYYGETILLLCQLQLRSQQPGQCTAPDQPLTAV